MDSNGVGEIVSNGVGENPSKNGVGVSSARVGATVAVASAKGVGEGSMKSVGTSVGDSVGIGVESGRKSVGWGAGESTGTTAVGTAASPPPSWTENLTKTFCDLTPGEERVSKNAREKTREMATSSERMARLLVWTVLPLNRIPH